MAHKSVTIKPEELDVRFEWRPGLKKYLLTFIIVGALLLIIGLLTAGGHEVEAAHHASPVAQRFWGNLLINAFMFTAVSLMGLFLIAVSTVSNAGWFIVLKRVFESVSSYLPIGIVFLLLVLIGGHDVYHWMDEQAVAHDELLQKKVSYLNVPFFITRAIIIFAIWILFYFLFQRYSKQDDIAPSVHNFDRTMRLSGIFLLVFALSFSVASWDWIMSVNPHWFSTMFAVYTFASAFVMAISFITLVTIYLKKRNYLPFINKYHVHDMGKYLFAFSIFWTYIWYGQFMLIWYGNIPEETQWFAPILKHYSATFYFTIIVNFFVPFLGLMTNTSKRNLDYLAVVATIVFIGHWLDYYLMVIPNLLGPLGGIGLIEVGMFLLFVGIFQWIVFKALAGKPLVPKYHPYVMESVSHHFAP